MELNLQPQAPACRVSGRPFAEGDRVASYLVRGRDLEIARHDVLESEASGLVPEGVIACRWVHAFKPRSRDDNPDRQLKLTAENLFLNLVDPLTEPSEETSRLVRFLALMLERKRILRPKGRTPDGAHLIYEHARTKQVIEVPVGDFDPQFFLAMQEQLGALVGSPTAVPAGSPAPGAANPAA